MIKFKKNIPIKTEKKNLEPTRLTRQTRETSHGIKIII
jgi:hypothetical protein